MISIESKHLFVHNMLVSWCRIVYISLKFLFQVNGEDDMADAIREGCYQAGRDTGRRPNEQEMTRGNRRRRRGGPDPRNAYRCYSDNAHDVTASPATTLDGSGSCLL